MKIMEIVVGFASLLSDLHMNQPKAPNFAIEKLEEGTSLFVSCLKNLEGAKTSLSQILSVQGTRDEANTLVPYNELEIYVDKTASLASLMSETHPDKAVRDDAERCEQEVHRFATELSLNRPLYEAFQAVDLAKLDGQGKRLVEKTLRDFRRSGVDKDEATRQKIKAIEEELVLISQEFGRNIRDDMRSIQIAQADLKGLPQDFIDAHKPDANGKVTITTDYPDYVPFMTYAEKASAREELWMKYMNRASPKNENVLNSMIQKRHELANLLGYASYADFVVETKMIKTTKNVSEFIEKISDIAKNGADKEYAQLLEEKRRTDRNATQVFGFERSYIEEQYKKRTFGFDSQTVRPYFRFEKVRDGLLSLTSELFDVQFKRVENGTLWHASVETYDVFDGSKYIGRIYLDLHPRENKYKHAAQFTVQSGVLDKQIPEGALVCNFADPSVSQPALMDHDQVVTFFHEFGHLMHHVLGGHQKWITFSGVATEWDFVEAPSQFFEEWAWDVGVLQRFALHFETGEPIPADLVARMRAAEEFGKGVNTRGQMFYAALSLNYYSKDPSSFNALELLKELQLKYSKFPYVENTHFNLNFGHLDGYSAIYYTYMWSQVIAKDLLTPFKKNGLMSHADAKRYRQTVLEAGGSKDAAELVQDFLGRPYNFDAFKQWLESEAVPNPS
jgi:thimet oligopeptidase